MRRKLSQAVWGVVLGWGVILAMPGVWGAAVGTTAVAEPVGGVRAGGVPALDWSFADWQTACSRLPMNRVLRGRIPPPAVLPFRTFGEFAPVIEAFDRASRSGALAGSSAWVGDRPSPAGFLTGATPWFLAPGAVSFEPFAQKLAVPSGSQVFLHGDLHGDVHSLNACVAWLNREGYLKDFAVARPNVHLVFLGDYTDRGAYGLEVLYVLLRLKLENPDRVWLVRGNHEEASMIAQYGFVAEGRAKYGAGFDAVGIARLYDYLPVVLYLGVGTDYVQANHGGMEPGYDPGGLLDAEGGVRFQLLGELRQRRFLLENAAWPGDPVSRRSAAVYLQDFRPATPTSPSVLGFMWNDFTVASGGAQFTVDPGRAFVYGDAATREILSWAGTEKARVRAVVRAHQHSSVLNPMMQRLVSGRGVFRHWQAGDDGGLRPGGSGAMSGVIEQDWVRRVPDGSVWTFNVSPDSAYGMGSDYHFDTFGVLETAETFGEWKMRVVNLGVSAGGR